MLLGNGIWNKQLEKFIIQDVQSSIPSLLAKTLKVATDTAHRIDYAVQGGKEIKRRQLKRRLNRRRKIKFML